MESSTSLAPFLVKDIHDGEWQIYPEHIIRVQFNAPMKYLDKDRKPVDTEGVVIHYSDGKLHQIAHKADALAKLLQNEAVFDFR